MIVRRWPAAATSTPATADPAPVVRVPALGVALAAAALLLPATLPWIDGNRGWEDGLARHALPTAVAGWSRATVVANAPRFVNADATDAAAFHKDGDEVQAFSAAYLQQVQGGKLADFENRPLGEGLSPVSNANVIANGAWLETQARDRAGGRMLVRLSYRVDGSASASLRRTQFAYGIASLTRDPVSSALVLRASCGQNCDSARATLDRFMEDAHLIDTPVALP